MNDELPEALRRQLDELDLRLVAVYLADRVGLRRGQLRVQIKDGRYENMRCVVTPDALK